jgi:hypothetical protein
MHHWYPILLVMAMYAVVFMGMLGILAWIIN